MWCTPSWWRHDRRCGARGAHRPGGSIDRRHGAGAGGGGGGGGGGAPFVAGHAMPHVARMPDKRCSRVAEPLQRHLFHKTGDGFTLN